MSFFRNMTLERAFIVLSLIGSLALAVTGYRTKVELNELAMHLDEEVPKVANELQELSREYSSLHKAKMGEGFLGQKNVESYIRRCKDARGAEIGQISITHSARELDRKNAIFDHVYLIKTQNSETTLGRRNIVTFLRELELKSQQMRVTSLQFRLPARGRAKAHEIPADAWLFDATCTSRQKKEA
jgi:hypothetical protein